MRVIYPEEVHKAFEDAAPYLVIRYSDSKTVHRFKKETPSEIINGFYKALETMKKCDEEAKKEIGMYKKTAS